jgi:glycosyltransferase involved in cell wall biosynthesis
MISLVFSTLSIPKFFSLWREVRDFDPDVIYYPMSHSWTILLNVMFRRYKRVMTIHDVEAHLGEGNFITEVMSKITLKQCDQFIILSHVFLENMADLGVDLNEVTVIPHGLFDLYNTRAGNQSEKVYQKRLLFFGRISEYKGIGVLLRAFKLIRKREPEATLLVVGSGDMTPYEKDLDDLSGVEVINRWIYDEEVENFFAKGDILIVPYIDASQSGVILTAYGFSMPVIASDIGGLPEQVVNGKSGILVEPGNVEALANACVQMLGDPKQVKAMGDFAYAYAKNTYNWDTLSSQLLDSFDIPRQPKLD